jgi:hypothetical protein
MGLRMPCCKQIKLTKFPVQQSFNDRTKVQPKLQIGFSLNGIYTINSINVRSHLEADIPSLSPIPMEKIPHVRIDSASGFCDSNMTDTSRPPPPTTLTSQELNQLSRF